MEIWPTKVLTTISVCMYVYVCMYECMYVIYVCMRSYVCMYACILCICVLCMYKDIYIYIYIYIFICFVVCLTIDPQPLPKRVLQRVSYIASSPVSSTHSFPSCLPVAASVFFLVFPSFIFFLLSFLQ